MNKQLKVLLFTVSTLLSINVGIIIGTSIEYNFRNNTQTIQPNCPTEDSCIPEYNNGQWLVKEIVP